MTTVAGFYRRHHKLEVHKVLIRCIQIIHLKNWNNNHNIFTFKERVKLQWICSHARKVLIFLRPIKRRITLGSTTEHTRAHLTTGRDCSPTCQPQPLPLNHFFRHNCECSGSWVPGYRPPEVSLRTGVFRLTRAEEFPSRMDMSWWIAGVDLLFSLSRRVDTTHKMGVELRGELRSK